MKPISILIADDHALVRMGLAALFASTDDLSVVGQARDGREAVRLTGELHPDIVLMDLQMPRMNGIDATQAIRKSHPDTKVIILTTFSTSDGLADALEAGAEGAFMKSTDNQKLIAGIRKVASGGKAISPEVQRQLATDPPLPKLSPRQAEIVAALTKGLANKEIAESLGLSIPRVEELIRTLLAKLHAANRTEIVAIALRKHLLKI